MLNSASLTTTCIQKSRVNDLTVLTDKIGLPTGGGQLLFRLLERQKTSHHPTAGQLSHPMCCVTSAPTEAPSSSCFDIMQKGRKALWLRDIHTHTHDYTCSYMPIEGALLINDPFLLHLAL